jgi:hypothetical protein
MSNGVIPSTTVNGYLARSLVEEQSLSTPAFNFNGLETGTGELAQGLKSLPNELLIHIGDYLTTDPQAKLNFIQILATKCSHSAEFVFLYSAEEREFLKIAVAQAKLFNTLTEISSQVKVRLFTPTKSDEAEYFAQQEIAYQRAYYCLHMLETLYKTGWAILKRQDICKNNPGYAYKLFKFLVNLLDNINNTVLELEQKGVPEKILIRTPLLGIDALQLKEILRESTLLANMINKTYYGTPALQKGALISHDSTEFKNLLLQLKTLPNDDISRLLLRLIKQIVNSVATQVLRTEMNKNNEELYNKFFF